MLITLVAASIALTLGGQLLGYFSREEPILKKLMFVIWGLSVLCTAAVFWLNGQNTFQIKQWIALRDLTPAEMHEASTKVTKFFGQSARIVIFPVNFETNWMASNIWGILLQANWSAPHLEWLTAPPGKGLMVQGVAIDCSHDDASKQAGKALSEALRTIVTLDVFCGVEKFDSGAFDYDKPLVWIFVGDKPAPLGRWISQ